MVLHVHYFLAAQTGVLLENLSAAMQNRLLGEKQVGFQYSVVCFCVFISCLCMTYVFDDVVHRIRVVSSHYWQGQVHYGGVQLGWTTDGDLPG